LNNPTDINKRKTLADFGVVKLNDMQASRVIIAAYEFNVRPEGYFADQSRIFSQRSKLKGAELKKAMRSFMGALTRKVCSELDDMADKMIEREVKAACLQASVPAPSFDSNWVKFVVDGKPIASSSGSESKAVLIAKKIANDHLFKIESRLKSAPKKTMKAVQVKLS